MFPKLYPDAVPAVTPPHSAVLLQAGHVQALMFTAERSPGSLGLDCRIGAGRHFEERLENRRTVASVFGVAAHKLLTTTQEFSDVITVGQQGWSTTQRPGHNAIVLTSQSDYVAGVLTADCAPVLMADLVRPVAAAVHVGWRQAAEDILEQTLEAMERAGSKRSNILVAIGPCAGVADTYTVSDDFAALPPNNDPELGAYLSRIGGRNDRHFHFQDYVERRLNRCGIGGANISRVRRDTIADTTFYSRRRNGAGGGLMFSGIKLRTPIRT